MIPALSGGLVLMALIMLAAVCEGLFQATRRQRARKAIPSLGGDREIENPVPSTAATTSDRARVLVLALSAGVLSLYAATTKAFTFGAEVACTIAFAAMAIVIVTAVRKRAAVEAKGVTAQPLRTYVMSEEMGPWVMAVGAMVIWELATYFAGFGGHRQDFPTLSVIFNDTAKWSFTRAAWFFLWLAFGWGVFRP